MPENLRFCRNNPAKLYFAAQQNFHRIRIVQTTSCRKCPPWRPRNCNPPRRRRGAHLYRIWPGKRAIRRNGGYGRPGRRLKAPLYAKTLGIPPFARKICGIPCDPIHLVAARATARNDRQNIAPQQNPAAFRREVETAHLHKNPQPPRLDALPAIALCGILAPTFGFGSQSQKIERRLLPDRPLVERNERAAARAPLRARGRWT